MTLSNLNWLHTSILKTVIYIYFLILLLTKSSYESFAYLGIFWITFQMHVIYVCLAYFFDRQRKENFINNYILNKQKEGFQEILSFFPEHIIIQDVELDSVLYMN